MMGSRQLARLRPYPGSPSCSMGTGPDARIRISSAKRLSDGFKGTLPTVEELEAELGLPIVEIDT